MNFVAYEYCILLWQRQFVSMEKIHLADQILAQYEWLLNHSKMPKVRKISLFNKFFGLKITSKILYIYMKLR